MKWFDCRNVFHAVPHNWITCVPHLAKVPQKIIDTIQNLMKIWSATVHLMSEKTITETKEIDYYTGVLQGYRLFLILFILSINPLFFLFNALKAKTTKLSNQQPEKKTSHTFFFVDDLKRFAQNLKEVKIQLDLITMFTSDIRMQFGIDKCSYIYIE